SLALAKEYPLTGTGGGSFPIVFEQSPRVSLAALPDTPHNDYLLVLVQFGIVGVILLGLPIFYVFLRSYREWRAEGFHAKLKERKGTIMPPRKFFLSMGLAGALTFGSCLFFSFVYYVPALSLYGALFFGILVKSSFNRS